MRTDRTIKYNPADKWPNNGYNSGRLIGINQ